MLKTALCKEAFFSMHESNVCAGRTSFPSFLFLPTVILLLLLTFPISTFGQAGDASISGRVSDPAGRVVQEAEVTIKNVATNVVTVTATNEAGIYTFPSLPPGNYVLTVHKQGFQSVDLVDLTLYTQDRLERNFTLSIGSASESVTVTGGARSDSPDVATVIDRELIENMPLNGKDMTTLFELSPGTILNAGGSPSNGGGFSVDGQQPTANYLTIDGASGNAYVTVATSGKNVTGSTIATSASGGTNGILPIDAIEEYRMDTSTYTAENGRTPGGQVQVRTRSGTNDFHGTLFENFRNQVLDAEDWFVKYNKITQSQLRMNDFGGTLGGPVVVPHLYNGKNKLFFFVAHDTLDLDQPNTASNLPVPSQSTIQMAATVFKSFLAIFPAGNTAGGSTCSASDPDCDPKYPGFDLYSASYPFEIRNHTTSIRVDAQLPRSFHAFLRANIAPSSSLLQSIEGQGVHANIYTYTGGFTAPIRLNLINDLTVNWTSNSSLLSEFVSSTGGNDPGSLAANLPTGVSPSTSEFGVFVGLPATFGATGPADTNSLSQWNTIDTVSIQNGKHSLKFGTDFLAKRATIDYAPSLYFVYLAYSNPPFTNLQNGILDYLEANFRQAQPIISMTNLSLFANDAWRNSSSLTVNLGLRWEYNPPPSIGPLGVLAVQGNNLNPSTVTAAVSNQPLYQTVYTNFAPRLGFAWNVIGKGRFTTVLRGGVGTYFDTGQASTGAEAATSSYPYLTEPPLLQNVPANSVNWKAPAPASALTLPLSNIYLVNPGLLSPRTYEWSMTLQQSFGRNAQLSTNYIGNDGEQLIEQGSYYNKANSQGVYPVNTNLVSKNSYLYLTNNLAHSNYQALQVQFTGRMASQLNGLLSYTWEHAEDNGATEFSSVGYLNPNPMANSAFDIPNQFSGAIHYAPGGMTKVRIARALTSGWAFDTIGRFQSSSPFSIIVNQPNPNAFAANADVVPGVPAVLHENVDGLGRTVPGGKLINYQAFTSPPTDASGNPLRQGNSPTNGYRLFALKQWDLAASHSWDIHEGLNVNFRVDAFNVLNIVNFSEPQSYWFPGGAAHFGEANSTYAENYGSQPSNYGESGSQLAVFQNGGARSLQLALKVKF